jgi:hypothetical protein
MSSRMQSDAALIPFQWNETS